MTVDQLRKRSEDARIRGNEELAKELIFKAIELEKKARPEEIA